MKILKFNNLYIKIINELNNKLKIENNKLTKAIFLEINNLNQSQELKLSLKNWIRENLILLKIKKSFSNKNIYLILDEGIIHRIFIIFTLNGCNIKFLRKVKKIYKQTGKIIFIKSDNKKIFERSIKRKTTDHGYIYKNYGEVVKESKKMNFFIKIMNKSIQFSTIKN